MPPQLRLSVVIPFYNEERTLKTLVERVIASCGDFCQIILIDDGSKDQSLSIARSVARTQDLVLTKANGGKGSAVRMGFEHARGAYVIVQDADLEYNPAEIPMLLAHAEANDLPAVFGSRRMIKQSQYAHIRFYIGGVLLTMLFNVLFGTRLTDQSTCYKLVRTDIVRRMRLRQNDFRFDTELAALLARMAVPVSERPISYTPRSISEGKKIGWRDFVRSVLLCFQLRFAAKSELVHDEAMPMDGWEESEMVQ